MNDRRSKARLDERLEVSSTREINASCGANVSAVANRSGSCCRQGTERRRRHDQYRAGRAHEGSDCTSDRIIEPNEDGMRAMDFRLPPPTERERYLLKLLWDWHEQSRRSPIMLGVPAEVLDGQPNYSSYKADAETFQETRQE